MVLRQLSTVAPAAGEEKAEDRDVVAVEPIRVLVADGSPFTRAGIRPLLLRHRFRVCAEVADAGAAVEAALRERPDVCIIDTELPGGAIDAVKAIAGGLPGTSIVMFAPSVNHADLFSALQAGASGYICKDTEPSRLVVALRRVCEGEAALPPPMVMTLIEEFRRREQRRHSPLLRELTVRELEVLELLAQGNKTAEIAGRLFVARVTVRTHVASILRKLGVSDREAAIRLLNDR